MVYLIMILMVLQCSDLPEVILTVTLCLIYNRLLADIPMIMSSHWEIEDTSLHLKIK